MIRCSETDCENEAKTRGMCRRHYHMAWRHGAIEVVERSTSSGETEAFIRQVVLQETDGCIIWPYAHGVYGYANVDGKRVLAHRAVCILAHGPPPFPKAQAAHYKCGNELCMNKRHIRWSTVELNHDDKRRHGTMSRGERHPHTKLTNADVLAIASDKRGPSAIARERDVPLQIVERIRSGETWSWLTGIKRKAA